MKKIFTLFAALAMVMSMSATPYLRGSFNNWGTENEFINGECSINLAASITYEFKIANADWSGEHAGGKTITKNNCNEVSIPAGGNNAKITSDLAGTYIFKWNASSKKLTVTYPTVVLEKKDITVKAKMPASWGTTITAWVWTAEDGNGKAVTPEKQGDWYVVTQNTAISYVIFRNGDNWNGDKNQTVDLAFQESTCVELTQSGNSKATYTIVDCPDFYNVTVTANAEGEDVVTGGGEYEEGKKVTVTASEDLEGWVFIGWTEDGEFVANDPEYTFVVKGDVELVAVYAMDLGENKVTDLVIDGDNMLLTGSVADFQMGTMNLELALGEYNEEEGTYLLTEESKLYVGETNFTFVDGMAAVDMNTNSAMAMVVFEHNGTYYYMTVNMSKKIEATIIEIADATVTIEERSMGFGDEVYHVLKMESTWSDGETTYPVSLETTEFDQTKESQEVAASITVGGMGDEDPWLGNAEGDVTITVADGVVTVEGLLENAYAWPAPIAFDVTISGKLPVEKIAYELNGGAFPEVKVPTNEELALAFKQEYAEYFDIEGLTDTDMKREVGNFIYVTNSKGGDAVKFITENANWKWLHDYILTVAGNIPEGTNVGYYWRANLDGFFHCKNAVAVGGVASADYTEAGKQEVWGAAYQAAHAVVLPTEPVDAPYTLPTPVKEGYTFVGWYDNAEGTGEAYTVIPAGWSGTLYAIWEAEGPATALDNIAIEGKVVKTIINGQLIIIKNGVQYNAQGAILK